MKARMGERELQQSAATVNKCRYIQDPDPLAHTAAVSSLTPMETVEADAENAIPLAAANIDTAVSFDRPTTDLTDPTKADQLKEMEADSSESNCQKVSATDEQIKPAASGLQNCPNCLNSRVILVKYGSRPGEKRHKCCKCHRWFGDVVKGAVVDKSEVGAPPPKKVRKNKSVSQEGLAPPENQLTSFPVSTTATTSSQTDSDDLFMASFKEQLADTTSFDKDDAICLRRKLKMAQIMLRESRVKIGAVEKQRDDAFKVLRKLHTTVCQFKVDFHANMQRLQEDQSFLANEYATYLKELARGVQKERQAFDAEKARVKLMFDHCETKRRDLKAQVECKKEQLKQSQQETAMETRRCDVLTRDAYLATSEATQAKKNLSSKLFLRTNQKCATCIVSERVRDVLTNQIADQSNENDELKQQRERLSRKCEEKERICQMLTKTSERLQFEVNALNHENKRLLAESAGRTAQDKEEGGRSTPGSGVSLVARQISRQPNPSPPSSDQSNEGEGVVVVSASPGARPKKAPLTQLTQLEPPPPPPPMEPDDCLVIESESQRDSQKTTSAVDWDLLMNNKDWLRSQLEGCWELLVWYRKELKSAAEQKMYFSDRLEDETDAVEELIEMKDAELSKLQTSLALKTQSHEQLTLQLSQLSHNLSSYFDNQSGRSC